MVANNIIINKINTYTFIELINSIVLNLVILTVKIKLN